MLEIEVIFVVQIERIPKGPQRIAHPSGGDAGHFLDIFVDRVHFIHRDPAEQLVDELFLDLGKARVVDLFFKIRAAVKHLIPRDLLGPRVIADKEAEVGIVDRGVDFGKLRVCQVDDLVFVVGFFFLVRLAGKRGLLRKRRLGGRVGRRFLVLLLILRLRRFHGACDALVLLRRFVGL